MSLLLAPYNNAMRLGQGFNSFTQQICVDDAVVVDPNRAENVITNDGTTMRIIAQTTAKPSAWTRQNEVVIDARATDALESSDDSAIRSQVTGSNEDTLLSGTHVPKDLNDTETIGQTDSPPSNAQTTGASSESLDIPGKAATEPMFSSYGHDEERERSEAARRLQDQEERERIAEQRAYQKELDRETREEQRVRRAEEQAEQRKIREEKRQADAERREAIRQAAKEAAASKAKGLDMDDLNMIKAQNELIERYNGMAEQKQDFSFDPTAPRGTSQTVIYTSKFVDKLSDVTEDMCVSGSLSIKAARVGGSGRGSFVDSDKFKESDLNFYISVKVINQTLNFKDALVFNPIRSVDENSFQRIYGDSFISGFIEGGEFNALVSMKVLNKAKMLDIKAEAKVAFTTGTVDVTAEANVNIAQSNISTNTETTIQVSWCGGGRIKPMEQQWDIHSLMQAAARFPDLVADCPQRTYAILTKYESLRSFVARRPASYPPLQYENAQIYTNTLLDTFMYYKSMYKRLGEQIFNIQSRVLELVPWPIEEEGLSTDVVTASSEIVKGTLLPQKDKLTGMYPYVEDVTRFEASMKGLSEARKTIRRQMMRIVTEVDLIEKDPMLATDEDRLEPYQSPVVFETRLPRVKVPQKLQRVVNPLSGKRLIAKTQTEEEHKMELEAQDEAAAAPNLYTDCDISDDEKAILDKLKEDNPGIGVHLQVTSAIGTTEIGEAFTNMEFLQPDWEVKSIRVEVAKGAVASMEVAYENGLILKRGKHSGGFVKELGSFQPGERIINASVECGEQSQESGMRITAIRLYTNRGRRLLGQANINVPGPDASFTKDGVSYTNVKSTYMDCPFPKGTFRGVFGRCDTSGDNGITRLGLIWGDLYRSKQEIETPENGPGLVFDYGAQSDTYEIQALRNEIAEREKALKEALALRKPPSVVQSGDHYPPGWKPSQKDMCVATNHKFPIPYVSPPRVINGLTRVEHQAYTPVRISVSHENVTPASFDIITATTGGVTAFQPASNWMALPDNDIHFETGVLNTFRESRTDELRAVSKKTYFARRFNTPPTVVSWFSGIKIALGYSGRKDPYRSLKTDVSNITEDSCNIKVSTWGNRDFESATVGWLAYGANSESGSNHRAKSGMIEAKRSDKWKSGIITFEGEPFSRIPTVFIALALLDAPYEKPLRIKGVAKNVTIEGFEYGCGPWTDDENNSCWVWVAVE